MILYEADITSAGKYTADSWEEGYLITFIDSGPKDFRDYCLSLNILKGSAEDIKKGNLVYFDDKAFEITAVGSKALENLNELGHVTVKFSGSKETENPGDITVSKSEKNLDVNNLKKFIICDDFYK